MGRKTESRPAPAKTPQPCPSRTQWQEFLEAGELEAVAQADHLDDLGLAVDARIEADRPVDLAGEVVENPPHGGTGG